MKRTRIIAAEPGRVYTMTCNVTPASGLLVADLGDGLTVVKRDPPRRADRAGYEWVAPYAANCSEHGWIASRRTQDQAEEEARRHAGREHRAQAVADAEAALAATFDPMGARLLRRVGRLPGRLRRGPGAMTVTRRVLAAALLTLGLAGCGGGAPPAAHHLTLHYTAHEPLCTRAQLGWAATVTGDGHPFTVICALDGTLPVWGVPVPKGQHS